MTSVSVDGADMKALVDCGSTRSIISAKLVSKVNFSDSEVMTVNGDVVPCAGTALIKLNIAGCYMCHNFLVMNELVPGISVIIGLDLINRLGGVDIRPGIVKFPNIRSELDSMCAVLHDEPITINDIDFTAEFRRGKWTVAWRWKREPPDLTNQRPNYGISPKLGKAFDDELKMWIKEGWLQPVPEDYKGGILPMIAVEQPAKANVRPVLDFRHVNQYVMCHTAQADVCDETIRRWRQWRGKISMLDLRKAYLQILVDTDLWRFQVIRHKGRSYYLTRLGFDLSSAPRIMSEILRTVLKLDPKIAQGTDNYIDDFIVNEDIIIADEVIDHL